MKRYLLILFALAISLQSFGQNTEAQNLTLINVVRNNTLSPARVANALDALNYSKQGILQAFTASGTDTYAVTGPVAITAYASGQIVVVSFTNANTGAATLNINSTGAVALKDNEGNALGAGELVAGGTYIFKHNGTDFWMVGASGGGGGSGTVNSGTQYRIAHYATTGTAVSEASAITAARALKSDANGVPTHFDTATEPSLTELTYVKGVTSALQTQLDGKVNDTGDETVAGVKTFSSDPIIPDEAYDATSWNASLEPPTKNAVRDKIEAITTAKVFIVAASDESTALTTGTGKLTFRMPYAMTLTAVRASVNTAQGSGSILTVDINEGGTTVLSTKLTIDNSEETSTTAATAAVISDSSIADDAEITIDIDQVGTAPTGLKITLIGN
jgi:hypothetical protein